MATVRTRGATKVVQAEVHQAENGNGSGDQNQMVVENGIRTDDIEIVTTVEKPKKATRKKTTPKKKAAPRQAAPKPKEIRDFMQSQAEINASILEQLRQLNKKDKCGQTNNALGSGGQASEVASNKGKSKNKNRSIKRVCDVTDSSTESESDQDESDDESIVRRDISEANSLLQARFNKTTEPSIQNLLRRAEARQNLANRPGTEVNNRNILNQFIRFMCHHRLCFKSINSEIICAYIEKLVTQVKSPATIRNYISALNVMYQRMNIRPHVFLHLDVRRALKATDKTVRHVPCPANLVTPDLLRSILFVVSHFDHAITLRFLFICMFMSLLRQSNFMPASVALFDPSRQLTRGDVTLCQDGLHIVVKWEKNMQVVQAGQGIVLPFTNDKTLCPIRAYRAMLRLVPSRAESDPLIMFRDYNPITLSFVQDVWKRAITALGKCHKTYRLHGLRRGGATYVAAASPDARKELQDAGRWNSSAYQRYIANPRACATYEAWARL